MKEDALEESPLSFIFDGLPPGVFWTWSIE